LDFRQFLIIEFKASLCWRSFFTNLSTQKQLNNPNSINMPSISTILKGLVALAPLVAAAPANYARQEMASMSSASATPTASTPPAITEIAGSGTEAAAGASGTPAAPAAGAPLSDVDILNL
jgi:hypothetical protein